MLVHFLMTIRSLRTIEVSGGPTRQITTSGTYSKSQHFGCISVPYDKIIIRNCITLSYLKLQLSVMWPQCLSFKLLQEIVTTCLKQSILMM